MNLSQQNSLSHKKKQRTQRDAKSDTTFTEGTRRGRKITNLTDPQSDWCRSYSPSGPLAELALPLRILSKSRTWHVRVQGKCWGGADAGGRGRARAIEDGWSSPVRCGAAGVTGVEAWILRRRRERGDLRACEGEGGVEASGDFIYFSLYQRWCGILKNIYIFKYN